jgi:type-F conjugative transfer system pilin assembly protein TrbC
MLKKTILLSSALLLLNAENINKQFSNKYLQNVNVYQEEINNSKVLDNLDSATSSFKFKTHYDKNESKKYSKGFKLHEDINAKQEANQVYRTTQSSQFNKNVKGMEEYIINDKALNYKSYMGKYSKMAQKIIKGKYNNNTFLGNKQKIYIVISSSMPITTIQNYIRDVQPVRTDITFVMRGVIGNMKHFMPTIKWVNKLITKPNCDKPNSNKCKYRLNFTINPKVTEHFNIKEVPAVIFVKNYDGYLDEHTPLPKKRNEKAYIAYGDANIHYALEKINKKAKDKYLTKLIKAMNKNWFTK